MTSSGDDPGTVDGVFGSDTENATRAFQTRSGHTITGKIIDQTWSALMQSIDARKSPSISMKAVFK
jgi:peptidoglycan hydrolase-like protein with peptidoglycan-binding domain